MRWFSFAQIGFVCALCGMARTCPGAAPAPVSGPDIRQAMLAAVRAGDDAEIARLRLQWMAALRGQAGIPDGQPTRSSPVDVQQPPLAAVEKAWLRTLNSQAGRLPWESSAKKDSPPRPRATARWVRALWLTDAAMPGQFPRAAALARGGAQNLLDAQASTGVFGYPIPASGDARALAAMARKIVAEGKRRGVDVTEKGRIIDDLGEVALNFDNGEAAVALLVTHAATGEARWLDAARRSVDWGLERPLVLNWNYNCFHAWAAARLYRLTGQTNYLHAAVRLIRHGVLAGQMDDGNWVDRHNAMPQYRSVMIRACLELHLALRGSGHPYASELEQRTRRALDSLAAYVLQWGFDGAKSWEALDVDAFSLGLLALGPVRKWQQALDGEVNWIIQHQPERCPESMATYLVYRWSREKQTTPLELQPDQRPAPAKQTTRDP